ncbi:MAG: 3-dehydroquinate synthase [Flavobacteriales bacterium]|nr:3-dehydroquinate synthase [Flavobacteriales bacterium]MBL6872960.1 3-dehydroquinate synthase [Flavobacteriales bacterium]
MRIVKSQNYSIYVGNTVLKEIDVSTYSKIAILVDENTKESCLDIFLNETNISYDVLICISSGETHKTINTCQLIWDELSQHQFDRKSLFINLGGGVIGDMGGFAASCYKRGIDFIQIPTTLLAMVDASIGGKLGIDFSNLKNQIGLFKNPKSVYIFPSFLNTLDKEQLYSGYAEVIKHALIYDAEMWKTLSASSVEQLNWEELIERSVKIKNEIVKADPTEKGVRKILNFGHNIGHAIESYYLSIGKEVLHGQAVATGMLLESKLSSLSIEEKTEIHNFLHTTFKIIDLPNFESVFPFLKNDKKNESNEFKFSLLSKIGKCDYNCTVDLSKIKAQF